MFPAEAGIITDPPEVTVKTNRTHCEHCQEPLDPAVYHKCAGNEEYKPHSAGNPDPELPVGTMYPDEPWPREPS
jgi:hypothetical protein